MKKKRTAPKLTAEDHARFEETSRMLEERIAYHEAKAGEEAAGSKSAPAK